MVRRFSSRVPPGRRKPPDWMQPVDDRILEILDTELILSPTIIADNIGYSRAVVSRRLKELLKHDLVEKISEGRYVIGSDGQAYLAGELEFEDNESN